MDSPLEYSIKNKKVELKIKFKSEDEVKEVNQQELVDMLEQEILISLLKLISDQVET